MKQPNKGIDMDESLDGQTQYCLRCEHPLNLNFEHSCVIPENAHEIGSTGRLPANHSEIRSTLAVPSLREEFHKKFGSIHNGQPMPCGTETENKIADFFITKFNTIFQRLADSELLKYEYIEPTTMVQGVDEFLWHQKIGKNVIRAQFRTEITKRLIK